MGLISKVFLFSSSNSNVNFSVESLNNSLVRKITPEDIKDVISKGVTLLDIYAPWCPPCQKLAPMLEKVAQDVEGRVKIVKLDGDAFRADKVIGNLKFQSYPTLILFKDGKEVRRITQEERSEERIKEIILEEYNSLSKHVFFRILGFGNLK